ncbi:unnamed protein product, partial [Porites evermanni]
SLSTSQLCQATNLSVCQLLNLLKSQRLKPRHSLSTSQLCQATNLSVCQLLNLLKSQRLKR